LGIRVPDVLPVTLDSTLIHHQVALNAQQVNLVSRAAKVNVQSALKDFSLLLGLFLALHAQLVDFLMQLACPSAIIVHLVPILREQNPGHVLLAPQVKSKMLQAPQNVLIVKQDKSLHLIVVVAFPVLLVSILLFQVIQSALVVPWALKLLLILMPEKNAILALLATTLIGLEQ